MTISKWTAVGTVAVVLLLGYAAGRFTTPAKLVEKEHIVTVDRDTELTWHAYVGHTESRVETKTNWKTETKWLPGGTVVQTVVADQGKTETTSSTTTESDGKVREVVKYQEVEKEKLVEARQLDWLLGARAGLTFTGKPAYGLEVDRRVIGPVFIGAWLEARGAPPGDRDDLAGGIAATLVF